MNEKEKTDQILRISDIFIREYPTWENVIDTLELNSGAKENVGNTLLARLIRMGVMYPRYSDELQVDCSLVFGNVDEFELMFDSRAKKDFADDAKCGWTAEAYKRFREYQDGYSQ